MLSIRFLRIGKKHQPLYKIVVIDKKRSPKSGKFIEQLGFYNPFTKEKTINKERIQYWLSNGAQPSDTLHNFLIKENIIQGKKVAVHSTKQRKQEKVPKKETLKEEAPKKEAPKDEALSKDEAQKEEVVKEEVSEEKVSEKEASKQEVKQEVKPEPEKPKAEPQKEIKKEAGPSEKPALAEEKKEEEKKEEKKVDKAK